MRIKRSKPTGQSLYRRGAAAVEAALVLPLLIIVTFGAIDLAQFINLSQLVVNASREGARIATRNTTETVQEVEDTMVNYMSSSFPHMSDSQLADAINFEVKRLHDDHEHSIAGGDLSSVTSGDPISVHVEFDFTAIRWIRGLTYWDGDVKSSTTICRRE